MDISNLKRNSAAIEAGQWIDDIPGMGDLRLRVRGFGSEAYQRVSNQLARAVPPEDRERDGALKPPVARHITGQAMHEAILLEWDHLKDGDKDVPFDSALALTMLTDPDFRRFVEAVTYAATVVDNGRAVAEKKLTKN